MSAAAEFLQDEDIDKTCVGFVANVNEHVATATVPPGGGGTNLHLHNKGRAVAWGRRWIRELSLRKKMPSRNEIDESSPLLLFFSSVLMFVVGAATGGEETYFLP